MVSVDDVGVWLCRVVVESKAEEVFAPGKQGRGRQRHMETWLGVWCMSPAVGFAKFASGTRSVILASGVVLCLSCASLYCVSLHVFPPHRYTITNGHICI